MKRWYIPMHCFLTGEGKSIVVMRGPASSEDRGDVVRVCIGVVRVGTDIGITMWNKKQHN